MIVVRDLAVGKSTFKELCASPEGIATNILTDRLNRLIGHGLVRRHALPDQPGREAYSLTPHGQTLRPVLSSIAQWGLANIEGTQMRIQVPAHAPTMGEIDNDNNDPFN